MLDFSRFADAVSSLLGGNQLPQPDVLSVLADAGIDLGMLGSMGPDEVIALLGEHGIDLAQLAPSQLEALTQAIGPAGDTVGRLLSAYVSR